MNRWRDEYGWRWMDGWMDGYTIDHSSPMMMYALVMLLVVMHYCYLPVREANGWNAKWLNERIGTHHGMSGGCSSDTSGTICCTSHVLRNAATRPVLAFLQNATITPSAHVSQVNKEQKVLKFNSSRKNPSICYLVSFHYDYTYELSDVHRFHWFCSDLTLFPQHSRYAIEWHFAAIVHGTAWWYHQRGQRASG